MRPRRPSRCSHDFWFGFVRREFRWNVDTGPKSSFLSCDVGRARSIPPSASPRASPVHPFPMRASRLWSLWPDMRPLRFRRVPFGRDGAFDPGGATASRIAMPPMLPSTVPTASASAMLFSGSIPHPTRSLCTLRTRRRRRLRNTRFPAVRYHLADRSFTGRNASASPDAPEPEVRIHFPPAESQLRTRLRTVSK